jgi:hypothetical protein
MIEIRELQNDLATGWPFVPFVHKSGLHTAGMHKLDLPQEFGVGKCDLASIDVQFGFGDTRSRNDGDKLCVGIDAEEIFVRGHGGTAG